MSLEIRKNSSKPKLCSIQYLHHDSPFQQMLLNSQPRHPVIEQEDEDQLFDLYITPYHIKPLDDHIQRDTVSQDTTLPNFSKKDQISTQQRKTDEEKQLTKLKRIIDKKNKIIAELTEELRSLNQHFPGSISNQNSCSQKRSTYKRSKGMSQKGQKQERYFKELQFLQKNNTQLFEELNKCRTQRDSYLQKLKQTKNKIIPQLQQKLVFIQKQNEQLKKHNKLLLQETKQYIKQGKKQVKYVSKMRQILAQKTGINDFHFQVEMIESRRKYQLPLAAQLSVQLPKEKKKERHKKYAEERYSRSQSKNIQKQNKIQRCLSNGNTSRFKQ